MVFYVIMVAFRMTLHMNKWMDIVMDDGWVHPLAETLSSIVNNLRCNIVMDDRDLDENHQVSDNKCITVNL